MKKRKTIISKNMAAVCEDLRSQQRELLQRANARNFGFHQRENCFSKMEKSSK